MRANLFLVCTAALLLTVGGSAQKTDLGRAPSKTVTLVSFAKHKSPDKSVFNFASGGGGSMKSARQPLPDEPPRVRTLDELNRLPDDAKLPSVRRIDESSGGRVRNDIRYGGINVNGDDEWLEIADRYGSRSMLADLGEMRWQEVNQVPILPASPRPHPVGLTFTYRHGRAVQISPAGVSAKAVAGHIYVMHVKDAERDYYVMFRVESLEPRGECRLSWKRVPSPEK
jgi:hypothetical protein